MYTSYDIPVRTVLMAAWPGGPAGPAWTAVAGGLAAAAAGGSDDTAAATATAQAAAKAPRPADGSAFLLVIVHTLQ